MYSIWVYRGLSSKCGKIGIAVLQCSSIIVSGRILRRSSFSLRKRANVKEKGKKKGISIGISVDCAKKLIDALWYAGVLVLLGLCALLGL